LNPAVFNLQIRFPLISVPLIFHIKDRFHQQGGCLALTPPAALDAGKPQTNLSHAAARPIQNVVPGSGPAV
jgi:hypothetical protein